MFGDITPDANFLLQLLAAVSFLSLLVDRGLSIASRSKAQKREVSFVEEFARREDLTRVEQHVAKVEEKLEHALEGLRCEMKEDRELIMRAGEDRAAKIHERINVVLGGVERLAGRMEK